MVLDCIFDYVFINEFCKNKDLLAYGLTYTEHCRSLVEAGLLSDHGVNIESKPDKPAVVYSMKIAGTLISKKEDTVEMNGYYLTEAGKHIYVMLSNAGICNDDDVSENYLINCLKFLKQRHAGVINVKAHLIVSWDREGNPRIDGKDRLDSLYEAMKEDNKQIKYNI
ncbi:hypothetical protein AGMMS49992_33240 [Clostridia bacterium]|nr:hypothetical protein AGMMS49992_33240 [Clostridia bacterium]